MPFELNARQDFLKNIAPFNELKNEIRERLYLLKVNDTREIETLILLMFALEIFSIKFKKLRNPAGFVVKLVHELIQQFNSAFPKEKQLLNESGIMKYVIHGPDIDPEKLRYQLEKLEKYLDYKNSKFCKSKIREIIKNFCGEGS